MIGFVEFSVVAIFEVSLASFKRVFECLIIPY